MWTKKAPPSPHCLVGLLVCRHLTSVLVPQPEALNWGSRVDRAVPGALGTATRGRTPARKTRGSLGKVTLARVGLEIPVSKNAFLKKSLETVHG